MSSQDPLQRVRGVIISRDGGEGDKVSIHRLSSELTLTQLNGNYMASIDGSDNYEPPHSDTPPSVVEQDRDGTLRVRISNDEVGLSVAAQIRGRGQEWKIGAPAYVQVDRIAE